MSKFWEFIVKWKLRIGLLILIGGTISGYVTKTRNDVRKLTKSVEVGISFDMSNSTVTAICEKPDGTYVQVRTALVGDGFVFIDNNKGPDEMYGANWSKARGQFYYIDYNGDVVWLDTKQMSPETFNKLQHGF